MNEISYADLKLLYPNELIKYDLLLTTIEWKEFREKILKRDSFRCTKCKNPGTDISHFGNFIAFSFETIKVNFHGEEDTIENEVIVSQDKFYQLQVHHKYYKKNKLPWEYDDHALITLCQFCHIDFHKKSKTLIFENETDDNTLKMIFDFTEYENVKSGKLWIVSFFTANQVFTQFNLIPGLRYRLWIALKDGINKSGKIVKKGEWVITK